jgi:hypothetical protein
MFRKAVRWGTLLAIVLGGIGGASADDLPARFADPPVEAGMTTYWIWFGPAMTREQIDRDLANMQQAHINGTVLLPMYPLSADDPAKGIRNLPFLSAEYLDILKYAGRQSHEKGMTFDAALGTGWPYGGPWITPDLGARMIRMCDVGQTLKPDEEVVATFGNRRVVSMPTRMMVKRPSIGDEGLVLDHYNPKSLARHLDVVGEKYWHSLNGTNFRIWCDSLEVFNSNWTPGFLDSFRRMRGYDLAPHLEKLFDEPDAEARQVRHDYWQTLSELAAENFYRPLQQWCHAKGVELRAEPYGQPPVSLGSFQYVDQPTGEHYEWRMFNGSRWASSGGHLFGHNIIGAEAWTWIGRPNRFADTLEQLKLTSDMHFVSGVNTLMGVAYYSTPSSAGKPGWVGYNGPYINHTQTWWPYFPLLGRYVQRVSWLLQQGKPVADVALYLPMDDVFAESPASSGLNLYLHGVRHRLHGGPASEFGLSSAIEADTPVVSTIVTGGYNFDGIDSATLPSAEVAGGHLRMGLGDYRIVVLPNLTGMPLADLQKLARFVNEGGCLIATRRLPEVAYGRRSHQADTQSLLRLLREMFAGPHYGQGRAILVADERESLREALATCVEPDLQLERPDHDVSFVHRRLPDQDFYFLANLGSEEKSLLAKFRGRGANVEIWDPMNGAITSGWDGTLHLDPRGSIVVRVASQGSGAAKPAPAPVAAAQELTGTWKLRTEATEMNLERLVSWTEIPGMLHFSGTASYTTDVNLDPQVRGRVVLDLGEVREIAEVVVNGRPAGVAWKRPYRVDVTPLLSPGRNTIEVKVTNLWINAMLGRPRPNYAVLKAQFGERFPDPVEWKQCQPLPSGLLGPVRLMVQP